MTTPRVGWRRIEAGLVGSAGADGFLQGVVYFEDDAFRAVVAVEFRLVLTLNDGESVHDVVHRMARRGERFGQRLGLLTPLSLRAEVEVEKGGVQLAAEQEAAFLVPTERRAGPTAVLCERFQVPGCVGQLQNPRQDPIADLPSTNRP